ncbi:DUF4245 family protein [Nocardioides limicola]|uniref:DUF4245 family protein n=1 Tax=Nocardioides limicola TaxID=2803368 RepID=UPI00193C5B63|nr:DUF4245 family protein [Nocardioides sp. DJM-14]
MSQSRHTRSFAGLIGALVVTLVAVIGFVAFRGVLRDNVAVEPRPVEWHSAVRYLQEQDTQVAWPDPLPEGWHVREPLDYRLAPRTLWSLLMVTDDRRFVGVRQEVTSVEDALLAVVGEDAEEGESLRLPSAEVTDWTVWTTDQDHVLVAELSDDEVLLVYGTAGPAAIQELATRLTFAPRSG